MKSDEKLIFRNLNIGFGVSSPAPIKAKGFNTAEDALGNYFIEDAHGRVYLTADDIERISAACRFDTIEQLKEACFKEAV